MSEYDPATPVIPLAVAGQLAEVRERLDAQDRRIHELHGVVDQLVNELSRHSGIDWRRRMAREPQR